MTTSVFQTLNLEECGMSFSYFLSKLTKTNTDILRVFLEQDQEMAVFHCYMHINFQTVYSIYIKYTPQIPSISEWVTLHV